MTHLRLIAAAALVALSSGASLAADATQPVKTLFGIAEGKVKGELFDKKRLSSVFSKSFADTYRIAHTVAEMAQSEEMLFDYDPLIGGQDSCPLKDISYKVLPKASDRDIEYTPVEVSFNATSCFEGMENQAPAKRVFRVVEEDGHFVVDDYDNGSRDDKEAVISVKEQLIGFAEGDLRRIANLTKTAE